MNIFSPKDVLLRYYRKKISSHFSREDIYPHDNILSSPAADEIDLDLESLNVNLTTEKNHMKPPPSPPSYMRSPPTRLRQVSRRAPRRIAPRRSARLPSESRRPSERKYPSAGYNFSRRPRTPPPIPAPTPVATPRISSLKISDKEKITN